jgi:hydrogenase maturation protease
MLRYPVLVIGYGNTLRNDDGAGQIVAEIVQSWKIPQVFTLATHQLTPELAENIAHADLVIFVDATITQANSSPSLQLQQLEAKDTITNLGHSGDPRSLLSLAQVLYHTTPLAWWLLIPAVNFDFGENLSPITQQAIKEALAKIKEIINQKQP